MTARKCRARPRDLPVPMTPPPISLVRPLRGLETFSEETLRASFELDYPDYELLFCVQAPHDPIIPLVERLIAEYPAIPARLLIGDDYVSANPKLNNCVKGWDAAKHRHVVLADSNALPPRDYLQTMLAAFRDDTALVISMPIGSRPEGFWADVECAVLNTFQARWQYGAEAIGIGFAQGKNMMWRREVLDRAGGIRALAAEIAEDAASTKIIRAQGLKVRLVDMPFEQPLGRRTALGAAAARDFSGLFRPGIHERQFRSGVSGRLCGLAIRGRRGADRGSYPRFALWRRNAAGAHLRLGVQLALAVRVAGARRDVAGNVPGRLPVRRLRLAR